MADEKERSQTLASPSGSLFGAERERRSALTLRQAIERGGQDCDSFCAQAILGHPALTRITNAVGRELLIVSSEMVRSWLHRGWLAHVEPLEHGYEYAVTDHGLRATGAVTA